MAYPTLALTSVNVGGYESFATSASIVVAGTEQSDHTQVLLIALRQQSGSISFSTAGWTLVGSTSPTIAFGRLLVYKRVGAYVSGATVITFGTASNGIVRAISANGSLDATALAPSQGYSTTATTPSVTAVRAETTWVQGVASAQYPRVLGAPFGTSALSNLSAHSYIIGFGLASRQAGAGATGTSDAWTLFDTEATTTPASEMWESVSLAFSIPSSAAVVGGGGTLPVDNVVQVGGPHVFGTTAAPVSGAMTVSFDDPVAAGSLVVVGVSAYESGQSTKVVTGVSDNQGNGAYTEVATVESNAGNSRFASMFYKSGVQSNGGTFTVTLATGVTPRALAVVLVELTGLAALDRYAVRSALENAVALDVGPTTTLTGANSVALSLLGAFGASEPVTIPAEEWNDAGRTTGSPAGMPLALASRTLTAQTGVSTLWAFETAEQGAAGVLAVFTPSGGLPLLTGNLTAYLGSVTPGSTGSVSLSGAGAGAAGPTGSTASAQVLVNGVASSGLAGAVSTGASLAVSSGALLVVLATTAVSGASVVLVTATANVAVSLGRLASTASALPPQVGVPVSDEAAGYWYPASGVHLYDMVDEAAPSDADWIGSHQTSGAVLGLGAVYDPQTEQDHVVRYRIWEPSGLPMKVGLYDGEALVQEWTHDPAPTTPTTFVQAVSEAAAATISNYGTLRFRVDLL
jgi:hypothetical protein